MGLTWILGFIATLARVTFLWYPFIVFNGLQGAFIFVMFDVKRKIAYMLWDKYVGRRGYQPPGKSAEISNEISYLYSNTYLNPTHIALQLGQNVKYDTTLWKMIAINYRKLK
jgi:hypothetical protein